MPPESPPIETATAPPVREPRPAPPVAHLLRQILRDRPVGSTDWAALAADIGVPEARLHSVAGFFEDFTVAPKAEAEPPVINVTSLVPEPRLTGEDDLADAFALVAALKSTPDPAGTIGNSLRAVERLDLHRIKADRPLAHRWAEAADTPAAQRFVVCHAEAGNPGAPGGDWVLRHRPGAVLAGMALAALRIGADEGVVCVDRTRPATIAALRKAIDQAIALGGLGRGFEVTVLPTFGSHVGGEETALLNAIEGRRGEARIRPPEPETAGIFGLPTVIETAETFALLPDWLRRGRDDGNRLIALLPPFSRPGLAEIDATTTTRRLLDLGGGGETAAALLVGGPFGRLVFPEDWDLPAGSGSLEPLPIGMAFRDLAERHLTFAAAESCGRCAPCHLGPLAAMEILKTPEADIHRLREILDTITMTSLCGFGRLFPQALRQWLDRWGLDAAAAPIAITETA